MKKQACILASSLAAVAKSPTGSADAAPRASYTDGQLLFMVWSSRIQGAHAVLGARRVCATRCRACIPQFLLSGTTVRTQAHLLITVLDLLKECGGATARGAASCNQSTKVLGRGKYKASFLSATMHANCAHRHAHLLLLYTILVDSFCCSRQVCPTCAVSQCHRLSKPLLAITGCPNPCLQPRFDRLTAKASLFFSFLQLHSNKNAGSLCAGAGSN